MVIKNLNSLGNWEVVCDFCADNFNEDITSDYIKQYFIETDIDLSNSLVVVNEEDNIIAASIVTNERIDYESKQFKKDNPQLYNALNSYRYKCASCVAVSPEYRNTRVLYTLMMKTIDKLTPICDWVLALVYHDLNTHTLWKKRGCIPFYETDECIMYCLPLNEKVKDVLSKNLNENKLFLTESEVKYIVKQGVERLLMESQESDSQKLAIRYIMENFKWDKEKADYFVRKTLRDRITPLKNKRIAKFTLGVTRMWFNGELDDDNTVSSFNATLPLLSAHINEYDKNLNGITARELISRFAQVRQNNMDNERDEIDSMDFSQGSKYQIHKIDSFEEAQKYYNYTNPNSRWCLTYMESMYNNYTNNGINQMYFCLRNGFESVPQQVGENWPLDEYGLSMLSIIVDEVGGLAYCTTRWNHENGAGDSSMNAKEISQVVGVNFYQVFKPNTKWLEITANLKQELMTDKPLEEIFDGVSRFGRNDEFVPVAINGRWNYVTKDREILCKKWFESVHRFDNCGLGMVKLNDSFNFVNTNGELISQVWFEWAQPFENGAALVGLETDNAGMMPLNYINKNGQLISKNNFEKGRSFSEDGYAPVCFDDAVGWTIIDRNGNDVLNGKTYSFISTVYDGRCSVSVYDPETHIDYFYIMDVKTGELLNKEPFHRLEYEGAGIYRVSNFSNTRVRFINSDAQYINDDVYDAASTTFGTKGVSAVRIGTKCNLLRPDGTYCSDVWFDAMANIRGTSCFNVYLEGYGNNIIDVHGKMLSSVWFTDTGATYRNSNGLACRMYMDKHGETWGFKPEGDSGIVVPSHKADFLI